MTSNECEHRIIFDPTVDPDWVLEGCPDCGAEIAWHRRMDR